MQRGYNASANYAKGLSLEKMDDLFGVTELVKQLEDDEQGRSASGTEKVEIEDRIDHVEIARAK